MTRRSYADVQATSPDGRLRLEALSADNGNELVRDGAPVKGESLGAFQRNFRYRLFASQPDALLWEHWQDRDEASPVRAWVSNGGHVVVRAHFLDWSVDQLLFFTRAGEKALVVIVAPEGGNVGAGPSDGPKRKERRRKRPGHRTSVWQDPHVLSSTAGPMWTGGSLLTFPSGAGSSYASLRTAWGRRLIVDLEAMTLLDESATNEASALVEVEERRRALDVLAEAVAEVEAPPGPARWATDPGGALGVVIAQRLAEAVPLLRRLEARPGDSYPSPCWALGKGWRRLSLSTPRALARLALRALGEELRPGGNYKFSLGSSSHSLEPDGLEAPAAGGAPRARGGRGRPPPRGGRRGGGGGGGPPAAGRHTDRGSCDGRAARLHSRGVAQRRALLRLVRAMGLRRPRKHDDPVVVLSCFVEARGRRGAEAGRRGRRGPAGLGRRRTLVDDSRLPALTTAHVGPGAARNRARGS